MTENGPFLTELQREYLRGNYEPPSKNAERQLRSQMRKRTRAAFDDLQALSKGLSQQDQQLIAESDTPPESGPLDYSNHAPSRGKRLQNLTREPSRQANNATGDPDAPEHDKMAPELQESILDTLEFLFALCEHGNINPMHAVETAMTEYHEQRSDSEYVTNVAVKPQKAEANRARAKMQRGEDLSATEAKALVEESGNIPDEPTEE